MHYSWLETSDISFSISLLAKAYSSYSALLSKNSAEYPLDKNWLNQKIIQVISTPQIYVMMLNQRGKLIGFAKSSQRKGISSFFHQTFNLDLMTFNLDLMTFNLDLMTFNLDLMTL